MNKEIRNYLSLIIFLLIVLFFFFGFLNYENASGAGGYSGDLKWIWSNLNIVIKKNLNEALLDKNYFDSRTPIAYLMHKYFNPFIYNIEVFRKSVFVFSLSLPIIFYYYIKKKYQTNMFVALLFISVVLLSPYFRSSSYWGLEENYSLILLILNAILILENKKLNSIFFIFLNCILSSLVFYFDQKLIIIPLLSLFFVIKNYQKSEIILCLILYFILSTPYMYLMSIWGAIIQTGAHYRAFNFNLENIGYTIPIIAFYFIPFFIFEKKFILSLKLFIKEKKNITLLLIVLIYCLFFFINFEAFNEKNISGNGILYKIVNIFFSQTLIKKIIFCIAIFFSSFFLLSTFTSLKDRIILFYFTILGLIVTPIYQEYFDPILYIMILTFMDKKIIPKYNLGYVLIVFNFIFLYGCIFYYSVI